MPGKKRKRNDENSTPYQGSSRLTDRSANSLPRASLEKNDAKADNKSNVGPKPCNQCHQVPDDTLRVYEEHPNDIRIDELSALDKVPVLALSEDNHPMHRLTDFVIFCKNGHLCSVDNGALENDRVLMISGVIRPLIEENSSTIEGSELQRSPILEWWVSGYDGGKDCQIGISTEYAEYYLMEPKDVYRRYMESVIVKAFVSKVVVEFLMENIQNEMTYEDLTEHISNVVPPPGIPALTEDLLLEHAQFVLQQINDIAVEEECEELLTVPCLEQIKKLTGSKLKTIKRSKRAALPILKLKLDSVTKATVTPCVKNKFEKLFPEQLEAVTAKDSPVMRCGVCFNCQQPDCGACKACRCMIKFGGDGRKEECMKRRCTNVDSKKDKDVDENQVETQVDKGETMEVDIQSEESTDAKIKEKMMKRKYTWGNATYVNEQHAFFEECVIQGGARAGDSITVCRGDFVSLVRKKSGAGARIVGRVQYMYENSKTYKTNCGIPKIHVQLFMRATDSFLGQTSDSQELFQLEECMYTKLLLVDRKINVDIRPVPKDWNMQGGLALTQPPKMNELNFFCSKMYSEHGIMDLPKDIAHDDFKDGPCHACHRLRLENLRFTPKFTTDEQITCVEYNGMLLKPGSFVFLTPDDSNIMPNSEHRDEPKEKLDENTYPEAYRKASNPKRSFAPSRPFVVAEIFSIKHAKKAEYVSLRMKRFYRPEDTILGKNDARMLDLNLLYASEDEIKTPLSEVQGQCWVLDANLADSESTVREWSNEGPYRFYFKEFYDTETDEFLVAPSCNENSIKMDKKTLSSIVEAIPHPVAPKKLRGLDIFAGCGGLSLGLEQSGLSESRWAIERDDSAANAFKQNNPNATVFNEDVNSLLKAVMNGEKEDEKGQNYPQKGEVDLIVGGPPCQGFSAMNRFSSGKNAQLKNSLIGTFLSFCDYYRPKFCILENVRNFAALSDGLLVKLAISTLTSIGYQCTFGVVQAGNFGVPQTRNRFVIMAAAPGETLPDFPEPTHAFDPKLSRLTIKMGQQSYSPTWQWTTSAPLRAVTVYDAMSDLPEINGDDKQLHYTKKHGTHFQRQMRECQKVLTDHECKTMNPLVTARLALIPRRPFADWRDLPNLNYELSNGVICSKLKYTHNSIKNGKSSTGALRGVCPCASGKNKKCDSTFRQKDTLIPWCLPHTSDRSNNWAGLYGRLDWNGIFSTTVTNPEPMGKQGLVVHPVESRVVSVRECARSQGFPDHFQFYGPVLEKHRQVGNAVPPPLAAALGRAILKSYVKKGVQHD